MTLSGGLSRKRRRGKQIAEKRKRQERWLIAIVGVVFSIIFLLVIGANYWQRQPIGGEQVIPSLGNLHLDAGRSSPVTYNSTPPTSGPHYGAIAEWDIYDTPLPYELVLHNLEDGGVVVYYQCDEPCPALVDQLVDEVEPFLKTGRRVVMMPNDPNYVNESGQQIHQDMSALIALTAWGRLDTFNEFEGERVRNFINRYEGIDHH